MSLLKFENGEVIIKPEALMIKAFRNIWEKDKSEGKIDSMTFFAWLYFVYDPRSDYEFLRDIEERKERVREELGLRKNWKITKDMEAAIEIFKDTCRTTSSIILENSRDIITRINSYMLESGMDELGFDKVSNVINKLPDTIKKLQEAEKLVVKELTDNERLRGEQSKKILEDGFNF